MVDRALAFSWAITCNGSRSYISCLLLSVSCMIRPITTSSVTTLVFGPVLQLEKHQHIAGQAEFTFVTCL